MSRTKQSIQQELKRQHALLNTVKNQIAGYGPLDVPAHRLLERDEIEEYIAELQEELGSVEDDLDEPVSPVSTDRLGQLRDVPELPLHFIVRPADLAAIKEALLADSPSENMIGSMPKVGLYGMGGIGKSVTAAAVARDEEIRRAFPDGIFWKHLGQNPTLETLQQQLAQSLSDSPHIFDNIDNIAQGKTRLSELLAVRACLLILDDGWQIEHIAAFNVLGPRCRMLVTSRDAGLIRILATAKHSLDVFSETQALALLAEWSGQAVETLPAEASDVAKECGYLPLALAMIGAQLHDRSDRWANVLHKLRLADLSKIGQIFLNYPHADLLRALHISVQALPDKMQSYYVELAVFPEGTPIPEPAIQAFWSTVGLDTFATQDILDFLVDRSLIRRDDQNRYSLHSLQYDYILQKVNNLPMLHSQLVAGYRQQCPKGWASGPDDNYFFSYLSYHLAEAREYEELYALINKSWMDAQLRRTFSHWAFAKDVEQAITVAKAQEPPNLSQVIRGCLIYATLLEVATAVSSEFLEILSQAQHTEAALEYASLVQQPDKQSEAYLKLGEALLKQNDQTTGIAVLVQAAAAAESIPDEGARVMELIEIGNALARAGDKKQAAMTASRALQTLETFDNDGHKAWVMGQVAQVLVGAGEKQKAIEVANLALEIADTCNADKEKAQALWALISAQEYDQAFQAAMAIEDDDGLLDDDKSWSIRVVVKAQAVAGDFDGAWANANSIADEKLKGGALLQLVMAGDFTQALKAAEMMPMAWQKAEVLYKLAEKCREEGETEKAVRAAVRAKSVLQTVGNLQTVDDLWYKRSIPKKLVTTFLEIKEFDLAIETAKGMEDTDDKVKALSPIISALIDAGEKQRAITLAHDVLKLATEIEDPEWKASALLVAAAPLIAVGKLDEVLAAAETITTSPWRRGQALRGVVGALAAVGEFDQASAVADSITDEDERPAAMYVMDKAKAQYIIQKATILAETEKFDEALQMAQELEENERRLAFKEISKALGAAGKFDWAVRVAKDGDGLNELAQILANIGEIDRALEVTNQIREGWKKRDTLKKIAKVALETGKEEQVALVIRHALSTTEITERPAKTRALATIAEALVSVGKFDEAQQVLRVAEKSVGGIAEAFRIIGEIENARLKLTEALATTKFFDRALEIVNGIKGDQQRVKFLEIVTEALVIAEEFNQALEVAHSIQGGWDRSKSLKIVAVGLAKASQFDQALKVADEIYSEWEKAEALNELMGMLVTDGQFTRALDVAEKNPNLWTKVKNIGVIAKFLIAKGDREQAAKVIQQAKSIAETITEPKDQGYAFSALVHILAEIHELDWALEVEKEIISEESKSDALRSISSFLAQTGKFDQALEVAKTITHEGVKEWALSEIGKRLATTGRFDQAVNVVGQIVSTSPKDEVLLVLAEVMAKAGQLNLALKTIAEMSEEQKKGNALLAVANALAKAGELNLALKALKKITDEEQQAEALLMVAQSLIGVENRECEDIAKSRVLEEAVMMINNHVSEDVLNTLTQVILHAGQPVKAQQIWCDNFIMARLSGRDEVFVTLSHSAAILAAFDLGETLWQVYEAIVETEEWWTLTPYPYHLSPIL